MVFTASLLGGRHLGEVVENKPASRLLCPWARHFTGRPAFMWKTGAPDTTETPKRVRTSCPKYSDTIRFLVNGEQIWQIKKKQNQGFKSFQGRANKVLSYCGSM